MSRTEETSAVRDPCGSPFAFSTGAEAAACGRHAR
jgi:hypothetical protein